MRYLTLNEILSIHEKLIKTSGGSFGIRDIKLLQSAIAQPYMTFNKHDLYPTLLDKVVALGYSLIMNHPFIDGNKRIGHASMEIFLYINGYEFNAPQRDQEELILHIAAGQIRKEELLSWVKNHVKRV